ncbi:MAG: hypothetical protein NXI04_11935 [Planctomycetaceae bacterium]|nr:hypothetical protein [Planctomycetaceae bacterium]
MRYDIAVIGNDQAAFETLSLAVCAGKRTLAVLPEMRHSSWIIGQALRRLVSGLLVDRTASRDNLLRSRATPRLLRALMSRSVIRELSDLTGSLQRQGAEVVFGEPRFASANELTVFSSQRSEPLMVSAENVVVGTGVCRGPLNRPAATRPFYGPEQLFAATSLPGALCIVGGGHFGAGLAALVSLFGVDTRHVSREESGSAVLELTTEAGVIVGRHPSEVGLSLADNDLPRAARDVVDCRRCTGFTRHLGLETISVEPDENGQLWCASSFETWCAGVFGVGDVVGFSPETALQPASQAQRVLNRIQGGLMRPRMLDSGRRNARYA